MKEIIYLDTELMNSLLAQLDEGLVKSFSLESSDQESESESIQSTRGKSAGVTGDLKVGTGIFPGGSLRLRTSLGNNGNESENLSKTILEGQKDILNKAFHDYALELLTKKLNEKDLLVEDEIFEEGDLHLGESTFRFYDFDLIKKSVDPSAIEKIMLFGVSNSGMSLKSAKEIVKKAKPTAKERSLIETAEAVVEAHESAKPTIEMMKNLNNLSSFASILLENLTIIKTNNKIGLLKKEFLRESVESLTFRVNKSRQVKYLVRIVGAKKLVHNGLNTPLFQENDLDVIPTMVLDIILGSFNIISEGDLLVTPIAIYYE
ncbi:DUF6414 family protein [Sporosarcina psychrophila]|uniref:Uncharacterized protein n=1 Tax=Sporosarcina psychrophila TaxID=1476 RepID=A0ABV2KB86_SPOPS